MKKIVKNAIKCKHCGDVIESKNRHDFVWCSCHTCAVDGGHDYLKRCYKNSMEEDFIELSETAEPESINPEDLIPVDAEDN